MCPSVPRLWAVWRARTKRTVVSAVCLTATSTPLDSAVSARPTQFTFNRKKVRGDGYGSCGENGSGGGGGSSGIGGGGVRLM